MMCKKSSVHPVHALSPTGYSFTFIKAFPQIIRRYRDTPCKPSSLLKVSLWHRDEDKFLVNVHTYYVQYVMRTLWTLHAKYDGWKLRPTTEFHESVAVRMSESDHITELCCPWFGRFQICAQRQIRGIPLSERGVLVFISALKKLCW